MLALILFSGGSLAALDFGSPPEQAQTPEEHVRAILGDFATRKGELLDVIVAHAIRILQHILDSSGDVPADILPPIRALGFLGRPQASASVARHLHHPDIEVRLAAIRSLGQMTKYDSIPLIEPFLASRDRQERREAIISLGKFGKVEEIPKVYEAAGSDPEFAALAGEAEARIEATVKGIRTKRFDDLVDVLIDTAEFEDLVAFIPLVQMRLLEILNDETRPQYTRERAMRVLATGRVRRSGPPMRRILADPNQPPGLRLRAAWGLGLTRARGAVDELAALLNDPDARMREVCVLSLGRIGHPRALEPLLAQWDADDGARRERIRLAAFRLRSVEALPALLEPLRSYQPRAIDQAYFITDSLELVRGYRRELIAPYWASPVAEERRDALLLLATFGVKADSALLQTLSEADADPLNQEIAHLGVERLKDIPIWERP